MTLRKLLCVLLLSYVWKIMDGPWGLVLETLFLKERSDREQGDLDREQYLCGKVSSAIL